ncbi:MAG: DUF3810 family protein, partial [Clostridia bacterium]|nr:DUF3810 family protein [Clostridia bacterium]
MGCCLFAWAILALLFTLFPSLALFYSNTIGHFIRTTIGTLFSLLPFSGGESLFYAFLLFLPVWICFLFSALKRKYALRRIHTKMRRVLLAPISVLLIVLTIFCFAFAPSYQRPAVSDILGLDPENIYDKDLYDTLEYFVNEINKDVNDLSYGNDGSSIMPMKFNELADEINHTYQSMDEYPSLCPTIGVPAKSFLFSEMMTAFNIGGIYTFYTGEANVNV